MSANEKPPTPHQYGTGELEFSQWETPFTNSEIEILEVVHSPVRPWPANDVPYYRAKSLLQFHDDNDLVARIYSYDMNKIYRVSFETVSAFRLLDEGGLLELWGSAGWRGDRTSRVRNHAWTKESRGSFISGTNDGWSFLIASQNECLEILSEEAPQIMSESD